MEHTGFHFHCDELAKSSSDSNLQQPNDSSASNGAPVPVDPNIRGRTLHWAKPNKNYDIPITPMTKIVQQFLPFSTTVKGDAKVIFPQCVSEYISFITAKAYERCKIECRKTLKAEDLLWAMENLGFDDYVGPLGVYLDRYRRIEGNLCMRRGVSIPVNVRQAFEPILESGPTANPGPGRPRPVYGSAPGPGPLPAPAPSIVGMLQSTLPPPSLPSTTIGFSVDSNANLDMVDPTMGNDEFLRDGSSFSSSPNDIANFDPSIFLNLNLDNL